MRLPEGTAASCRTAAATTTVTALYKDATAWAALDIMGVHQYDTQRAEVWPSDIPTLDNGVPPKPVWQTEMSGVKWWPEQGPNTTIENGIAVAIWVHDALTRGMASAWLWWWYRALRHRRQRGSVYPGPAGTEEHLEGHEAALHADELQPFVRPDYTRVEVTGAAPTDVLLSAYKGADGTVVVVAINKSATAASIPIASVGGQRPPC